jgi:hypothetical protein
MCNITVTVPGNQDNIGDDRGQASADSLVVVIADPDPGPYSQWSCPKIVATRKLPAYRLRQNYDYGKATA